MIDYRSCVSYRVNSHQINDAKLSVCKLFSDFKAHVFENGFNMDDLNYLCKSVEKKVEGLVFDGKDIDD